MDFLLVLWNALRELFPPFKIIKADEQGSKLHLGRAAGTLGPGLHWFWPYFDTISVYNVVYQQIDLPVQTVPTKDGYEVTFSANVGYVINDAQKMELNVQDFDSTLSRAAMGWLATKMGKSTYQQLIDDRTSWQSDMRRTLDTLVTDWGVTIKDVRLTDFCKTRQYRLFQ